MADSRESSGLPYFATSPARAMLAATSTSVVAVTPVFLLGATAVLIRPELGFGQAGLGVAVTAFFIASSLIAVLAGRIVEVVGATRSLRLICFGSGGAMMSIGVFADDLLHFVILILVAGTVNGFSQPAANLTLARRVRLRQGLMFGIKQSSVPFSTLVAGVFIPTIALQFGWRWTFGIAGLLSWLLMAVVPSGLAPAVGSASKDPDPVGARPPRGLMLLSVAAGAGTAGATAMAAFIVESASVAGLTVSAASWLLVAGSLAGVVARIVAGALADQGEHAPLSLVSIMLAIGAGGYLLLSVGEPGVMLVGALLSYAFGWGWTGLLMYAVVQQNPDGPAAASGVVLTGAAAGAAIGPLGFSLLVTQASFQIAWWACALTALTSAYLIRLSTGRLVEVAE